MTITRISKLSGVPLRTLQRWRTTKPFVFEAVCEKCERDRGHDNMKAAMQIVDTLSDGKTGIIELSVGGVSFNAKLDGYAILNDVFGKSVELHGFTIYCGKEQDDE